MVFVRVYHHVTRVLVVQILEKTLYLKRNLLLDIMELRHFSILEVSQEPILLLGPSLIGKIENIAKELPEELILEKRPLEILEVRLMIFFFMILVFET
jgi:hypothetical protein